MNKKINCPKPVYVGPYIRTDGTYVHGHSRTKPGSNCGNKK